MRLLLLSFALLLFAPFVSAQCGVDSLMAKVVINTDNYPAEIDWSLSDSEGNVLLSNLQYSQQNTQYSDSVCVASGECLLFSISDSYGDGICCSYGIGSYFVYLDGVEEATGGDYGQGETIAFNCPPGFTCDQAIDIDQGTHIAVNGNAWYTYTPDVNGSYFMTTCDQGNTCNTTMWIYEYCNMSAFEEDNTATVYFDDNQGGCGESAQLNVLLLEAGVEYWIRIGDNANDCAGQDITWTLGYNGPITGCTDPNACNYNPLASEDDASCIAVGDPACPDGPDLQVVQSVISSSMYLSTITADAGNCYVPEGCLNGYGVRDILRFSTRIENVGNQDYFIGSPSANPDQFDTENCHNHTHYKGYAEYLLYGLDGTEIPIGFKNGFCVLDLSCPSGIQGQYGCSNMGITSGCADIYSSGLSCQWIDITDTPDGTYTMVVRTNWDRDPDALGRHELDYNNNWAQVCITLDRSSGALVVTEDSQCDPFVDCSGEIYGDARPDCTGECNGVAVSGDVNGDFLRNLSDAAEYVSILCDEETMTASPCIDLDADGEITVADAAAMVNCMITDANHSHPPGEPDILEECVFPLSVPTNIFDEVEFSVTNINMALGYFDVTITNPLTKVRGYELDFDGVDIISAQNLIDDGSFDITPVTGLNQHKLIGLSYADDMVLERYSEATPLVRVFFSGTPENICLVDIIDVINEDYENAVGMVNSACGSCPEDLNGDGEVDVSDFVLFNSAFGQECAGCAADIDGDGSVGITDFVIFNSGFGENCINLAIESDDDMEEGLTLYQVLQGREDIDIKPGLRKAIRDLAAERSLMIYPNPNNGRQVQFVLNEVKIAEGSSLSARILDLNGKMVCNATVEQRGADQGAIMPAMALPSGSYFVELRMDAEILREQLTVVR